MNCNDAMNRILELDNGRPCDRATAAHLADCPQCSREYAGLSAAIASVSAGDYGEADRILTDRIMTAVEHGIAATPAQRDDYARWVMGGVLILGAMMMLPYTAAFAYLRELPGSTIDITLAVSFGLIVCVYLGLFIAANMNRLSTLLRRIT